MKCFEKLLCKIEKVCSYAKINKQKKSQVDANALIPKVYLKSAIGP